MFEVIGEAKTVQELQLRNRKRLRHFNKILDPRRNKNPRFQPADFEIYERKRETMEEHLRKRRFKQQSEAEVAKTEEQKEEEELARLQEAAYYANLAGTSLDTIINFKSKTPGKWMEKWEKNLMINPKELSTVVKEEKQNLSAADVQSVIASIRRQRKREEAARKKKSSEAIKVSEQRKTRDG